VSVVDSNIRSIFVVYFRQFEVENNSKIRQVHTILPLLTDSVQKNVEVRKQFLSEGWDTCTLNDKTLKALSKPSRRRERNSTASKDKLALRERANKSCSDRKNSRNS